MNWLVMVIDDSLTIRKILEICLRRVGYDVTVFQDGVEALRWLASPDGIVPALVLVDLGLPKLDGFDVIRRLKTTSGCEQTVLVILSKRDGVLDRIKGRLVGAHAYLTKPFTTQTIIALVQAYLGAAAVSKAAAYDSPDQLPEGTQAGSNQP